MLLFLDPLVLFAQCNNNEFLLNVLVREKDRPLDKGVLRIVHQDSLFYPDTKGEINLCIAQGRYVLLFQAEGYKAVLDTVDVIQNMTFVVQVQSSTTVLEEVKVRGSVEEKFHWKGQHEKVNRQDVLWMPSAIGIPDVMSYIRQLPGVSTTNELENGFAVRGGIPAQNLTLLDGGNVYYSGHVVNIFSTYNPFFVTEATMHKGFFPSQFSNFSSSVLALTSAHPIEENKVKVNATLGSLETDVAVLLPFTLKKRKGYFLAAARRNYTDLALDFMAKNTSGDINVPRFYYYEYDAKAFFELNECHSLSLTGVFTKDVYNSQPPNFPYILDWGNKNVVFKHTFQKEGIVWENEWWSTNFDFYGAANPAVYHSQIRNQVMGQGWRSMFAYEQNKVGYTLGIDLQQERYKPDQIWVKQGETVVFDQEGTLVQSNILGGFAAVQYAFNPQNKLDLSLRVDAFKALEDWSYYWSPRLRYTYFATGQLSFLLSYDHTHQYHHTLGVSESVLPTDIRVPSNGDFPPGTLDQLNIGANWDKSAFLKVNTSIFYRYYGHQVAYFGGFDQLSVHSAYQSLEKGIGNSIGWEVSAAGKRQRFQYSFNYTLSESTRTFEQLNFGRPFYTAAHKRHNLSLFSVFDISTDWKVSFNWFFQSGKYITLPEGKYVLQGHDFKSGYIVNPIYGNLSNYQFSPYHRLDFSISKTKEIKDATLKFSLTIFNLYNQFNPSLFFIEEHYNPDENKMVLVGKQQALIPFLPSLSVSILSF